MLPSVTPATQKTAAAQPTMGDQARHQSQPSAVSATPATQKHHRWCKELFLCDKVVCEREVCERVVCVCDKIACVCVKEVRVGELYVCVTKLYVCVSLKEFCVCV